MNPLLNLLSPSVTSVPFHEIKDEHYWPAFEEGLKEARQRLDQIKGDPSSPDFRNTIEAIEASSEKMDLVYGVFGGMLHANTNPTLQELAKKIMPELAKFSNDLYLDAGLFARVKAVHDQTDPSKLNPEQWMLLDKTYKAFVRNGALLGAEDQEKLRKIDERLAVLTQQYGDQLLKSTHQFELVLEKKEDLAGLPPFAVEAAAETAKEKGKEGSWVFTLDFPSYLPFMKFSERRELREKLWRGYNQRATGGDTDNRPLLKEMARLRFERARLLGFPTHAHFVLEERMASHPDRVRQFLDRILGISREKADQDLADLRALSGLNDFQPWDFAFHSEKLKQKKLEFREEEVRPYLRLENVVAGVFEHARRLYGIVFERRADLPVYHPDVQVFEVKDEKTGESIGLFYTDFHPRPSKQGGAWMMHFRDQGFYEGRNLRPQVAIVCNLTKPTPSQPALLDLNEMRTVFHEFGHALHGLLSKCHYRSLSGTNVYWDFVELPSQIMENWTKEKEGLDLFARHYQTGEAMPNSLVRKIRDVAQFQAGYQALRQLNFALLDFAWHAADPSLVEDVEKFEAEVTRASSPFPPIPGAVISPSFSHIFAGGYSAGYYSYKWAEVLDADAFEFFQEKGIFSREVAERFKEYILTRGGSEHPMELYKKFRGREPDPDALLRRDGLL